MSDADIAEIERSRKAGIRSYQMYGALANAFGGFHKVGFSNVNHCFLMSVAQLIIFEIFAQTILLCL